MWGKLFNLLRLDAENIPDIYVYTNWTNQWWQKSAAEKRAIKSKDTKALAKTMGYMDQVIKKA
jgi:hypothetical protein